MLKMIIPVSELKEGDRVDLESCPFLNSHPMAESEYAEVTCVKKETDTCILVSYEGVDDVGYPIDQELIVMRDVTFNLKQALMQLGNKLVTEHRYSPAWLTRSDTLFDDVDFTSTKMIGIFTEWLNRNEDAQNVLAEMGFEWPVVKQ